VSGLCARLAWFLPLALFCNDALAWGLFTHVYFGQLLIWAIPLADFRFRRAVARLPGLVLAGACLPDIALFSRFAGAPALNATHQWSTAQRVLAMAEDDESRALALGYASHLLADVIAHNHFVPAHEQLWLDRPVVTHAISEWAMDAYVAPHLFARPSELIHCHHARMSEFAATHFGCARGAARRALGCLRHGEALLRASRLPSMLLRGACVIDRRVQQRFEWYVAETATRLAQINRLIGGDAPVLGAEIECSRAAQERLRRMPAGLFGAPLPQDFF
jgi:hypothetical protein